MSVYKFTEIVGTSSNNFNEAIVNAIREGSKSVPELSGFEVLEQRGTVADGQIKEYMVRLKVGFRIAD